MAFRQKVLEEVSDVQHVEDGIQRSNEEEGESQNGTKKTDTRSTTVRSGGIRKKQVVADVDRRRRRKLLHCSLALMFVKIGEECGDDTVQDMLNVMRDEFFDLKEFVKIVKSVKDCNELVKDMMGGEM